MTLHVLFGHGDGLSNRAVRCVSRLTHVAIGDGHTVITRSRGGTHIWPFWRFIDDFPNLSYVVDVEVPFSTLDQLKPMTGPVSRLSTFRRLLTGGRTISNDCVSDVARYLRATGMIIPGTLVTPDQLFDYLVQKGCKHAAFIQPG